MQCKFAVLGSDPGTGQRSAPRLVFDCLDEYDARQ